VGAAVPAAIRSTGSAANLPAFFYPVIPDLIRRRRPKAGDNMRVAHGPKGERRSSRVIQSKREDRQYAGARKPVIPANAGIQYKKTVGEAGLPSLFK